MTGGAAFRRMLYNTFMRRTSVYTATWIVAGMAATSAYFNVTDGIWKSMNKGKSWEEVLPTLPEKDDDDDDY